MSIKTIQSDEFSRALQRFDVKGMYKIYDSWPEIAKESYEKDLVPLDFENISNIVFAGMGGSGSINDVFSSILSKTKIRASSIKSHLIPNSVDSETLVIATSVSGNTMETLAILDSARRLGSKIIAFSNGGKMQEYCNKYGLEHRKILMVNSPRASFISFLYSMFKVLGPLISKKNEDINESISSLIKTKEDISSLNLTETNPALNLALWITKIPLIYYPQGLEQAAIRFKNSLQENAKSHVMVEEVGEACHNGIVSWEMPSFVHPILIEGHDDHVHTKNRWKILKEYFEENKIDYREVFSIKGSLLSKLVNLTYIFDYSTIYLAVLSGIDPSPVRSINFVKNRLVS